MSRWTAPAECYLVTAAAAPVAGPFSRSAPLVAIIDRLYHEQGLYYSNASRYELGRDKRFARTKAGDAALLAAVVHSDLAERLTALLGKQTATLGGGYDAADWPAIDALLSERGIGGR